MSRKVRLTPNYAKLDFALRSIGYSFEVAVADIIDNSIDARATKVLVRLFVKSDGHLDLVIWDNGCGMDPATLKEAMRFGADVSREIERLGKFGLGLKLASLSQARELRVVTVKSRKVSGMAWLEGGIAHGFECTVFTKGECDKLLSEMVPDRPIPGSGTLVLWSRLYRVGRDQEHPQQHAQKLMKRLSDHLSLAFHRFLSGRARKLAIELDIFDEATRKGGIPTILDALDPFDYKPTGAKGFPAPMELSGSYKKQVSIKAHIWPPNSSASGYKLPGGVNSRQGFYFYRNNRLIHGGGWQGLREVEPHYSLARLEVDIAPDIDVDVSLSVTKVEIQLPPDLVAQFQKARTRQGVDFKTYLSMAQEGYRTRKLTDAELPLIPSRGLPASLTRYLHKELKIKATRRHRDLKFEWKTLDKAEFFSIDSERGYLYLNRLYRRPLLHGLAGSSSDIPVVKCLLFLVLEEALLSERLGTRISERIDQVNRILVLAVKFERVSE